MKKIISVFICFTMFFSLISCNSSTADSENDGVHTQSKNPNITSDKAVDNKLTKITWDEITSDGVNEKLLIDSTDTEILSYVAKEVQTIVDEETEAERANPKIVITEGWTRVFKSERYKNVLDLGQSAMKPLYLIIYKSEYASEYEYICASALYELSGYDFDWINSKDFLQKFNEKIISDRQQQNSVRQAE